jgi:hypothetical protein
MTIAAMSYRVAPGVYIAALLASLAIAFLAVPLAMGEHFGPAALALFAGVAGMVAAVAIWLRKREIVATEVGITVPVGPFALQQAMIPFRHILTVSVVKKTGGSYLNILHRSGKVLIPGVCLPKATSLSQLRDLVSQQANDIAGRARPIRATLRRAPERPAAAPRSFGQRGAASARAVH